MVAVTDDLFSSKASLSLPYFHINDVFLTGFARSLCKMPLVNAQSFFSGKIDASWDPAQILYHGVKPKAMTEVHEVSLTNPVLINKSLYSFFHL